MDGGWKDRAGSKSTDKVKNKSTELMEGVRLTHEIVSNCYDYKKNLSRAFSY
jgi:hypothetical protein